MKKYIVKQVYNEDNSIYFENVLYDIENNFNDDIMIGFNKDYKSRIIKIDPVFLFLLNDVLSSWIILIYFNLFYFILIYFI